MIWWEPIPLCRLRPILPAVLSYAVNGSVVYGAGKAVVAGSSFDPATMLGPLAGNGGPTQTCLLLGADNPARTLGMPYVDLSALGQDFDPQIGPEITASTRRGFRVREPRRWEPA